MVVRPLIAAAAVGLAVLPQAAPPATTPPATAPPATTPPATTPPAKSPPPTSPAQRNGRPGNTPPTPAAPTSPTSPTTPAGPTGAPPSGGAATPGPGPNISGRPPEDGSPLRRYEPRLWEVKLEANVYVAPPNKNEVATIQLKSVVAWVPIIVQNTWSQVDPSSVQAQLFVQGQPIAGVNDRLQWRYQLPHGLAAIGMGVGDVVGQSLRWNMSWREQVWNTQLNDAAAAKIPWPQDWPAEVQIALQPQPGIESDAPEFKQFVDRVSGGKLRSVTPFVAAKELVKATIQSFRSIDSTGLRRESGFTRGLILNGAYAAMQSGNATAHDVTAACVAVLRAAGIPARPVIGAQDVQTTVSNATRTQLITWVEFYLPNTGWIPFDPLSIKSRGNSLPPVDRAWPDFGNWDELNQRVPLSFTWSAPVPGSSSLPYPCVWSFYGSGYVAANGVTQDSIGVQMINRGRVRE